MQMDWKKASAGSDGAYTVYEPSTYNVEITAWKKMKAKNTSNDMLEITGVIHNHPIHEGGTTKDWITLTEASSWRLAAFLSACLNFDVSQLPAMDTDSQEFANLLNACKGRRMFWSLIVDTFEGKTKNKTAQRDPYTVDSKSNKPFDITSVEDVPEWVKE